MDQSERVLVFVMGCLLALAVLVAVVTHTQEKAKQAEYTERVLILFENVFHRR